MNSGHFLFDSSGHGNILVLGNGDQVYQGPIRSVFNVEEPSKRRIFFSSQDELYDDEFYDEQLPEKKRRLTSDQIMLLEKSFEAENKLEPDRKTQLARNLGLQPRQVAVWFQNRRARWKTKQLEREFDLLKASYNSLLSDIDLAVKENEKLKSEVKELAGMVVVGQKFNPQLSSDETTINSVVAAAEFNVKAENHLSSATIGSVVVDEDGPQLVDSGDSYFPEDDVYNGYNVGPINDIVHYEDDGGSDDNERYWVVEHHQEETETLNWWIWP